MKKVNDYLKANNKKIFLLYDQLDSRIDPIYWNNVVSPLINYWKDYYNSFSNILPKIFVRTDLMRRIRGTNTLRLENNFIGIEWTINEIFDYIDVMIDGQFKIALRNPNLKWKGSSNQRVIDIKKTKKKGEVVLYCD